MSFIFGIFYLDYYSYRSGLGFRLGLGLELRIRVRFLGFIMKHLHAHNLHQAFSLKINERVLPKLPDSTLAHLQLINSKVLHTNQEVEVV